MFRSIAFAVFAICVAPPALAEEGGELRLVIDGTPHVFTLWNEQSDWSGSESYASVNIYSRPSDDASQDLFSTFTLGFDLVNGAASNGEAGLQERREDSVLRRYGETDEDAGGLVVRIENSSVSGDELSVAGSFQTQMGASENYGRDIDLSDPVTVEGTFDVILGPVE